MSCDMPHQVLRQGRQKNVLLRLFGHLKPLVTQRLVNLCIYALCEANPQEQGHANGPLAAACICQGYIRGFLLRIHFHEPLLEGNLE